MAYTRTGVSLGILFLNLLLIVSCERVKEKMYKNINGAFCFKRLNGTHEFGCTSSRSGDTGVLHIIKTKSDLDWLLEEAKAAPYIVMLPFDFTDFTDTVLALKSSGKVSGLVLTSNRTFYSPDDICPNRYSGLVDNQCDISNSPWNKVGSSLLFVNFGFPVMYIDSDEYPEDIKFLNECFEKHNAHDMELQPSRSLCAVEIKSHMLAAVDSKTCIRRSTLSSRLTPMRYCDPLLGLNIHLPLFPRVYNKESETKEKSVILVVSRLDGTSMFDGLVPGAGSPIIGIVSLLAVAHVLRNLTEGQAFPETKRNVLFVFFHGESYDYIGSSRMIFDMENDEFPHRLQPDAAEQSEPLKLKHVGLIIDLDEVVKKEVFYHSLEKYAASDGMASEFVRGLRAEMGSVGMTLSAAVGRLPPSSLQRFLKKEPSVEGVVLSSYNASFDNLFYHSIFDTGKNLNYTYMNKSRAPQGENIQEHVADFSLTVARSLYRVLFRTEAPKWTSHEALVSLVDDLLYCYLESPSCEIFERVTSNKPLDPKPYPVYISVMRNSNITTLTALTLALLTGKEVPRNRSHCHNTDSDLLHQYIWMADESENGVCIETLMNYSLAQSPAFDLEDYDWASNEYSTWTESVWHEKMSARVFMKPSRQHEILTLSVGLLVFAISIMVVYFFSTKANILFNRQILGSGGFKGSEASQISLKTFKM